MLAYYGERISPHMTDTPEGFLICHDVPIGRTGEMEYLARELELDGDPERMVRVVRDEAEVFTAAALASFEGKPVTDGHPPENLRAENAAAYAKGHIQNVRRDGDFILADLHITDPNLISEVRNGVKREVSCGYSCVYERRGEGYRQRQIRGNHVAVVPKGRAGREVAIKDAAPAAQKGTRHMKKETKLALLRAFGLAAQDAEPEELERLTSDTAAVLDAGPALEALEAGPTVDAVPEQPANGMEAKLDKLIEMMGAVLAPKAEPRQDEAPEAPESKVDKAITELSSTEPERAEVITEENQGPVDKVTGDAAVRILKNARPVIAAMKDPEEKARVTDALLESIRTAMEEPGETLLAATSSAARRAALDSDPMGQISAQQAAYDRRNPHKKNKEDM